ncbi:hypothetical protein WJX77_008316 [Trebouxia sp. C0004]
MMHSVVVALVATAIALGPGVLTAAPAPAPSVAPAPSFAAAPTGNATESFVTLNVNPWMAGNLRACFCTHRKFNRVRLEWCPRGLFT